MGGQYRSQELGGQYRSQELGCPVQVTGVGCQVWVGGVEVWLASTGHMSWKLGGMYRTGVGCWMASTGCRSWELGCPVQVTSVGSCVRCAILDNTFTHVHVS